MHIYEDSLGRSPKEGKYPGSFCLWKESRIHMIKDRASHVAQWVKSLPAMQEM